jgi:hypothetical protein
MLSVPSGQAAMEMASPHRDLSVVVRLRADVADTARLRGARAVKSPKSGEEDVLGHVFFGAKQLSLVLASRGNFVNVTSPLILSEGLESSASEESTLQSSIRFIPQVGVYFLDIYFVHAYMRMYMLYTLIVTLHKNRIP